MSSTDCPPGFTFLPGALGCYQLLTTLGDYDAQRNSCAALVPGRSQSVVVTSSDQHEAIQNFFNDRDDLMAQCHMGIWTSGQRKYVGLCASQWMWKPNPHDPSAMTPVTFTDWFDGPPISWFHEPNCWGGFQFCLMYWSHHGFHWGDDNCTLPYCALCEGPGNYY